MIGQIIAHYKVTAKLGAGGMGVVYRATDTKLGRDVALKVLPEAFAADAQRMARFQREAQVLASLNHANIATIHGLEESGGVRALVMELVEGPTLAERIMQGAVSIEEALPIARQIAEALEYAHEKGIVHRDLKPANIKLTPDGHVKVLDFGLAKALTEDSPSPDISNSPTLSMAATRAGVILGTAAYMSPEQARGKIVDKRTDTWAFGCVLYELLTGVRAFPGEDVSESLAAVIRGEPGWKALPESTPRSIRQLLRRCLDKDIRRRLQAVGEARFALEEALDPAKRQSEEAGAFLTSLPVWRRALPWGIAMLAVASSISVAVRFGQTRPASEPKLPSRFQIALPTGHQLETGSRHSPAISADGRYLAYAATVNNTTQLFLRPLDQFAATPIPGTEGASGPFFSPDSQWLGFFADGKLKKVRLGEDTIIKICDVKSPLGASWGPDGRIVFGADSQPLMSVSAEGGRPEIVVALQEGELGLNSPEVLPGGKTILFTAVTPSFFEGVGGQIAVHSLSDGPKAPRRIVVPNASQGRYAISGHLVYAQDGDLLAVSFDLGRLEVMGKHVTLLQGVVFSLDPVKAAFSVSRSGTLAYFAGGLESAYRRLVWVDRSGSTQPFVEELAGYVDPNFSNGGRQLAVSIQGPNQDIWVLDSLRSIRSRQTLAKEADMAPVWAPDGERLYFSRGGGHAILHSKPTDGASEAQPILQSASNDFPLSFSPDGSLLAFLRVSPKLGFDIWTLAIGKDGKPGEARALLDSTADENHAQFSPDGKWLAYSSNESGRFEVFVRGYPTGGKWQVSADGGDEPRWSPTGRELFFRHGSKMMSAPVETAPTFSAVTPRLLFDKKFEDVGWVLDYDVARDGKRFLMIQAVPQTGGSGQLNVILNWTEELRQRSPSAQR